MVMAQLRSPPSPAAFVSKQTVFFFRLPTFLAFVIFKAMRKMNEIPLMNLICEVIEKQFAAAKLFFSSDIEIFR